MSEFDRDLKSMLDRTASSVRPSDAARTRGLHRARRKRIRNAAIASATAVVVMIGGFVGASRIIAGPDASSLIAGEDRRGAVDRAEVPPGEVEIARGDIEGHSWVLSGRTDERCFTMTVADEHHASGDWCGLNQQVVAFDFVVLPTAGTVIFAGDVHPSVDSLIKKVKVRKGGGGERAIPLELYRAPAELQIESNFFVSSVPEDATSGMVVADPDKSGARMARPLPIFNPECVTYSAGDHIEAGPRDGNASLKATSSSKAERKLERWRARLDEIASSVTVASDCLEMSATGVETAVGAVATLAPARPRGKPGS